MNMFNRISSTKSNKKMFINLMRRGYYSLKNEGSKVFIKRVKAHLLSNKVLNGKLNYDEMYLKWIETKEKEYFTKTDFESDIGGFAFKPLISIIMPVYNVELKWLTKAIESVRSQYYENWELCAVDDCSQNAEIKELLTEYANRDGRIKCDFLEENVGITGASNRAAEISTGAYLALLDDDDELAPNALFEVVKLLNKNRAAQFIYSDEDKIDEDGVRCTPYFKPDFSPDLLLSSMYTCHLSIYERELFFKCGAFKHGFEGSQDHDLALRASEMTDQIYHIPSVLYHWRKVKGSTAENYLAKDYAKEASIRTLTEACSRRSIKATVIAGERFGTFRVKREIIDDGKVSVIIPFKDEVRLLKQCIKSVYEKGGHKDVEFILVNNASREKSTFKYLKELGEDKNVLILDYNDEFNYSAMNNMAAKAATGKYLLFLNNDTKSISSDFVLSLMEHAQRPEVGVVGAKLLYDNMTVQHAGIILGVGGVAKHAFKFLHHYDSGYFGQANVIRNISAVTGACMMMRKELFMEAGGFDEVNLKISLNDVDLCLRLMKAGYLNVYTPYCVLYHFESVSRGQKYDMGSEKFSKVVDFMKKNYSSLLEKDPYYNINLSLNNPYYLPNV